MSDVIALGCGLVGKFVIKKLVERGLEVTVVDLKIADEIAKMDGVNPIEGDVFELIESLPKQKIAINMLPGRIGNEIRPKLLEAGHDIVDLAFTLEDPAQHLDLAQKNNSVLLWDVGIAPGLSNMLVKMAYDELENVDCVHIKVGGNPAQKDSEWSYMAPFSPSDVIEEYTRPARIVENSETVIVPALSERHMIEVDNHGEMEAFLTDGLRSILDSFSAKEMKEFTVRWPGHIDKWIEEGKYMQEQDLLQAWKFDDDKEEFTWLEVKANNSDSKLRWMVYDNGLNGDSSMARTTGLVTAACTILFVEKGPLNGCDLKPGIYAPENLSGESVNFILDYLRQNGVEIKQS